MYTTAKQQPSIGMSVTTKQQPSLRDIANLANVSISAVSLALRNKPGVGEETRQRVRDAAAQLGYVVAESEDDGRALAVAVLVERWTLFYAEVIHGLQAEALRLGYQVMIQMFDRIEEPFDRLCTRLA